MKHLIFLNGTRNGRSDEFPTNILKMYHAARVGDQVPYHLDGTGDDDTNTWDYVLGAAFGTECDEIRDMAYATLEMAYEPGDKIAVFGFSRGAAEARSLCSKIAKQGINGAFPEIAFLGCFDTVAAFLPFGSGQQGTLFHDLHVAPNVIKAAHAVSIHEDRKAFEPNLMNKRDGIEEVWFAGVHADVGGGYRETGLSDVALEWMIERSGESGFEFGAIKTSPDPMADKHHEDGFLRYGKRRTGVKRSDEWTDEAPVIHPSALDRDDAP